MLSSQLLFILVLATIAGLILFRLYTVLGRRTGNERPPVDRLGSLRRDNNQAEATTPVLLPGHNQQPGPAPVPESIQSALLAIKLANPQFEVDHFLQGARRAYEMIVVAFAQGDRETLRPLLSDDVFTVFDAVITERKARQEKVEFTFVGFSDAKITAASFSGSTAGITISFVAQFISVTRNTEGLVLQGDPKAVESVTDTWTFERNTKSADPNWRLVATSGEANLQEI
jgi:predicted lipid-binding transport protein (Tim44 family)